MSSYCCGCGGEFLGGEPPHQMHVSDERGDRIELYCIACIDWISWNSWNDEDWGPYPSRMQYRIGQRGQA